MPLQYGPVYSVLAEAASGYSLPLAWSWLPVDSDCLVLSDAAGTFQHLMERFPAEDLVASGVAERVDEGLVISPRLIAQDPGFIVLRAAMGDPFDIVTSVGCFTGVPPALKMFHDGKTKEAIRGSQYKIMFGVGSLLGVVLLRSLRVAVTPITLLEALNLSGLRRLLALTGGTARGDIPKRRVRMSTDEEEDEERRHRGVSNGRSDSFLPVLLILAWPMTARLGRNASFSGLPLVGLAH